MQNCICIYLRIIFMSLLTTVKARKKNLLLFMNQLFKPLETEFYPQGVILHLVKKSCVISHFHISPN